MTLLPDSRCWILETRIGARDTFMLVRITHPHEVEPPCRDPLPRQPAVALLQYSPHLLDRHHAHAHLQQDSYDRPHHVAHESVSDKPETHDLAFLLYVNVSQGTAAVAPLRFICRGAGEAAEIMPPDQGGGRLPHRLQVERLRDMMGPPAPVRRAGRTVENQVVILPLRSVEAGMKVFGYRIE